MYRDKQDNLQLLRKLFSRGGSESLEHVFLKLNALSFLKNKGCQILLLECPLDSFSVAPFIPSRRVDVVGIRLEIKRKRLFLDKIENVKIYGVECKTTKRDFNRWKNEKLLDIKPFFDYFYIAIPRFREFVTPNDLLGTGIGLISVPNYCFTQEGFKILKKANKLKRLYVPKFSYCKSLYQLASKISRDVMIENKEWKEHIKPNFLFWKSLRAMSQAKYLFREG